MKYLFVTKSFLSIFLWGKFCQNLENHPISGTSQWKPKTQKDSLVHGCPTLLKFVTSPNFQLCGLVIMSLISLLVMLHSSTRPSDVMQENWTRIYGGVAISGDSVTSWIGQLGYESQYINLKRLKNDVWGNANSLRFLRSCKHLHVVVSLSP